MLREEWRGEGVGICLVGTALGAVHHVGRAWDVDVSECDYPHGVG